MRERKARRAEGVHLPNRAPARGRARFGGRAGGGVDGSAAFGGLGPGWDASPSERARWSAAARTCADGGGCGGRWTCALTDHVNPDVAVRGFGGLERSSPGSVRTSVGCPSSSDRATTGGVRGRGGVTLGLGGAGMDLRTKDNFAEGKTGGGRRGDGRAGRARAAATAAVLRAAARRLVGQRAGVASVAGDGTEDG